MQLPTTATCLTMVSVQCPISSPEPRQSLAWACLPLNYVNNVTFNADLSLGADLATFLAVYGAIFDGDLTSYSIGGPVNGLLNLDGLLGAPQGLSGSHNKYEGDVSPTRGDLYE